MKTIGTYARRNSLTKEKKGGGLGAPMLSKLAQLIVESRRGSPGLPGEKSDEVDGLEKTVRKIEKVESGGFDIMKKRSGNNKTPSWIHSPRDPKKRSGRISKKQSRNASVLDGGLGKGDSKVEVGVKK